MKHLISFTMLVVCSAAVAEGQIQSLIPARDELGRVPTVIDSVLFTGFPIDDTRNMDPDQLRAYIDFITDRSSNQQIFLRGTADAFRFRNATSDADNARRNRELAAGRAQQAFASARARNVPAQIINPPLIDQPRGRRGVYVYKVTYENADAAGAANIAGAANVGGAVNAAAQADLGVQSAVQTQTIDPITGIPNSMIRIDSIFIYTYVDSTVRTSDSIFVIGDSATTARFLAARRWRFGVGAGAQSLLTFGGGGMEFIVPTISAFAQHDDRWFVTLSGGWRPMPEITLGGRFPPNMNRAETIASLSATLFPKRDSLPGVLGVAFTIRGAWETVRREDEFLERAYGISIGPRLRLPSHLLVLGLDFQVSNESRFRGGETRWRFGIAPTLSVNHTFGRRVSR